MFDCQYLCYKVTPLSFFQFKSPGKNLAFNPKYLKFKGGLLSGADNLYSFFYLLTLFKACYWADAKFGSWALFMNHWNDSIVPALQRKCRKARSKGSDDLPKTSKAIGKAASARQFIDDEAQEDNRFALDDDNDYGYYDNYNNDNDSDDALPNLTQVDPSSEFI